MADAITDEGKGFFACYMLTSLCPRYKGHTYIGFTVNPKRRIRQHNGEITSGAWRTKRKRPWEMVFCIYGFPSNVAALQFEWAWQHPTESVAVRKAIASNFKTLAGLANKIKIAFTMLTLHTWQSMELTVNFFSTKHMKHTVGCPRLPQQMKLQVCSMDDLPCYHYSPPTNFSSLNKLDDREDCWEEVECQQHHHQYCPHHHPDGNSKNADEYVRGELADGTNHPFADLNSCTEELSDNEQLVWSQQELDYTQRHLGELSSHLHPSNNERPQVDGLTFSSIINDGSVSTCTGGSSKQGNESLSRPSTRLVEAEESNYCWTEPSEQLTTSPLKGTIPPSSEDLEVIDLFTPPDCRMNSAHGKKKRVSSTIYAEIIDLTKSPIFVQL